MYYLNPEEVRLYHEERIAQVRKDFIASQRRPNQKPRKWTLKWFKNNKT